MKFYHKNKERYERFSNNLNSAADWEANRESIISKFLEKTELGKS